MPKVCAAHTDSPAVADCRACGRPVCLMCVEEADDATFCSTDCVQNWKNQKAPAPAAASGPCINHPESPAVGRCQVCEKQVCLMCLQDTPEGSFCSGKCQEVMKEVRGWVEAPGAAPTTPIREPSVILTPPLAPKPKAVPKPVSTTVPAQKKPAAAGSVACARCGRAVDLSAAIDSTKGTYCSKECYYGAEPSQTVAAAAAPGGPGTPAWVWVAGVAAVLVIGLVFMSGIFGKPAPTAPEPIAANPPPVPAPEPVPAPVKVEPPPPPPPAPKPAPPPPVVVPPPPPAPVPAPVPPPPPPKPVPPPPAPKPPPPPPAPPPAPVPPPKPPVAPHVAKAADPWNGVKPGAWFRFKRSGKGGTEYNDISLKELGPWYRVLLTQSKSKEPADSELNRWIEVKELTPNGDLALDVGGFKLAVDLVSPAGSPKTVLWVVREGKHAGVIVKSETPETKVTIKRLAEETLTLKDRKFDCLVVETEEFTGELRRAPTKWLSAASPAGPLKMTQDATTLEIVDFGADWTTRPPFPAIEIAKVEPPKPVVVVPPPPKPDPKPEPKPDPKPVVVVPPPPPPPPPPKKPDPPKEDPAARQKARLAEAGNLIKGATPVFEEVAGALENPPTGDARAALLAKAESARRSLSTAREIYLTELSSNPAVLQKRVDALGGLLETLDSAIRKFRGP